MLYVFTKSQLARLIELHPGDVRRALSALIKPSKISAAEQDSLIETGLFEYRGGNLTALVRTMSPLEAFKSGVDATPARVKAKPRQDPAEGLLELFCRLHLKYCHRPYIVTAADKAVARRLVSDLGGGASLKSALKYYVKHCHEFYPRDGRASVTLFKGNINDVLAKVAAKKPARDESGEGDSW